MSKQTSFEPTTDCVGAKLNDVSFEPVIGRHVQAEKELSTLGKQLRTASNELDIEHEPDPTVTIEVNDVDWDDSKSLQLKASELRKIVDELDIA